MEKVSKEIKVETVKEFIDLIKDKYTMSITALAKCLQCDIQWIRNYVMPNISYVRAPVFLQDAIYRYAHQYTITPLGDIVKETSGSKKSLEHQDLVKIIRVLDKSIWFKPGEVFNFVTRNTECTRSTIRVPLEILIPWQYAIDVRAFLGSDNLKDYQKRTTILKCYKQLLKTTKTKQGKEEIQRAFQNVLILLKNFPSFRSMNKQTEDSRIEQVESVPTDNEIYIKSLYRFNQIGEKFENNQTALRFLFKCGYTKAVLSAKSGKMYKDANDEWKSDKSNLIYYYYDDTFRSIMCEKPKFFDWNDAILVRYSDWCWRNGDMTEESIGERLIRQYKERPADLAEVPIRAVKPTNLDLENHSWNAILKSDPKRFYAEQLFAAYEKAKLKYKQAKRESGFQKIERLSPYDLVQIGNRKFAKGVDMTKEFEKIAVSDAQIQALFDEFKRSEQKINENGLSQDELDMFTELLDN